VGDFAVPLYKLDEADPTAATWSARHVADNSRIALGDEKTIAFLGEVDAGASAISIPLFDEAGIVQISPTDTYGGLTVKEGDQAGEPDRFYPRHDRMFARVIANDIAQSDLLVRWIRSSKAKRVVTLKDSPLYGQALADELEQRLELPRSGVTVNDGGSVSVTATAQQLTQLATKLGAAQNEPDAIVYAGTNPAVAARLFRELHRVLPQADLYAAGALGVPAFLDHLGPAAGATRITLPVSPAGSEQTAFAAKFRSRYGTAPTDAAAYGYTAMQTLLQALQAAGSKARDRAEVIDQVFKLTDRPSPLGPLTINDRDPQAPAQTPGKGDVLYDRRPGTFVPYTVGPGGRLRPADVPQTNS
jgi:branched-chain amino acid transport system substrate-binding protein